MFSLLPALDLTGGRLGVSTPDGPEPIDAFGGDPLAAARTFVDAGARWVHVVDMDLAFSGAVGNADVVEALHASHADVSIQVSGGIRAREEVATFVAAHASRVVIGSAALADGERLSAALAAAAGRALVGIEVADGRIRSRGHAPVDLDLMATLGWLTALEVPGFVVTAVARVGSASGPDLGTIRRVVRSGRPTLAAGGIASIGDLDAVRRAGAVGAIVGRGVWEGSLDLAEALAWAAEH